jgi:hypothetical protein
MHEQRDKSKGSILTMHTDLAHTEKNGDKGMKTKYQVIKLTEHYHAARPKF